MTKYDDQKYYLDIIKLVANRAGSIDSFMDLLEIAAEVENCIDAALLKLGEKNSAGTNINNR